MIGKAFVYRPTPPAVVRHEYVDINTEIDRLKKSSQRAREELRVLSEKLQGMQREDESEILIAQADFLEDEEYYGKIVKTVKEEGVNAEVAVEKISNQVIAEFNAIENDYFRQRAADVQDVSTRLMYRLSGVEQVNLEDIASPSIIVASDLLPSDTVSLNLDMVLAICTESGTASSHTAILARGLSIPAVVGCGTLDIQPNHTLIVNGSEGTIVVDPNPSVIAKFEKRIAVQKNETQYLLSRAPLPSVTTDGVAVSVLANIEVENEAQLISKYGAEGVGLLRTESLFFEENELPSEEQQYQRLSTIVQALPPHATLMVRTLDVGGDKPLPSLVDYFPNEQNPFLGLRGIRFFLSHLDLFTTQMRALLRISHKKKIKIFYPLVSTIKEVWEIKAFVKKVMHDLKREHIPYDSGVEQGIMIEVPSAALIVTHLFNEIDFVSIGSNDLVQYTLAADRTNEHLAGIGDYFDPAVLRLIQEVIGAGERVKKISEVCGEMAGDPLAIPLLLGMGLRNFSMGLSRIPLAKEIIRTLSAKRCHKVAQHCLASSSKQEVRAIVKEWCRKHYTALKVSVW